MLHTGRNIISLIFSRVLAGVILFIIYTRLAQYLGPEAAGQFGVLSVYLTVFSFFVDLGMSQLVIKKVSEDQTHAGKYLSNYFFIQTFLGLVFMLIMDAIVLFSDYPQIVKNSLYIAGFALLFAAMSLPFRSVINAFQKLTVIAKVNFFNSVINATFMVLAIVFRRHIFFLSFISVSVALFDVFVYWFIVHKKFAPFKFEIDWSFVKQLFIWAAPFTALTFFSVYNRIDTLLLSHMRDFTEVGYYSAAYKFWDTLAYLPGVIGISLYPFFAERLSKNLKSDVKRGLEAYTRYLVAMALPLAVGAFLLADQITVSFYGPEFKPAADALWLLVTAVCILIIYAPVNSVIISQETKAATKITGFNLFFNLIMNLILIPRFGFVAAAVVTVASETIQWLGYTYIVKKRVVDFVFFKNFIKPAIAVLIMGIVVKFLDDYNVWLAIGAGAISYSAALLLVKFFNKDDWGMFRAAIDVRKPINDNTTNL